MTALARHKDPVNAAPAPGSVLVVVPEYSTPDLTNAVLADLFRDGPDLGLDPDVWRVRLVVVDNGDDFGSDDPRVDVFRPGVNLRWIGATNWALRQAMDDDDTVCVVLNSDVRLSRGFLAGMLAPFADHADVALAAACYDDFWLHQRARRVPPTAADYAPSSVLRDVPFCDGTAIAFSVAAIRRVGLLDTASFPRHGYGSDLDLALRARQAGLRCVVTEQAYVSHLRRASMNRAGQTSERNRAEILDGMDAKWGEGWRAQLGLGPGAFPPHNTGSAATWYLDPPAGA